MQDYSGYGQSPEYATMPMPPMPPRPPRRRIGLLSYLAVALAAGALGAGSVVALYHPASSSSAAPQPSSSAPAAPAPVVPTPSNGGSGASASEQAILNKVQPGLVIIDTTLQYNSEQAAGTGMVIGAGGLVLTNNHVVEGSTSIKATDMGNGQTYTAKVLGYDVTGDIALLQLQNASGLRTVPIGDSATVKTGDSVVAMGNAEGQSQIVPAAGQVTALNQTITAGDQGGTVSSETLHGMIETNANIVSGDSGGPLANSGGQVIGMDTAGSDGGGGFGVQQSMTGFAIPINTALSVAGQIGAGHATSAITIGYPPFMGIYIATGSDSNPQDQAAQQNGNGNGNGFGGFGGFGGNGGQSCATSNRDLAVPSTIAPVSSGTLIIGIICGGPAAAAGITAGSVITAVNGQAIGSPASLTGVVSTYHPGQVISVTWVSPSGQHSTRNLTLAAGPPL
ncbi:MAG TPA: trypsin-like peptidase domain-containing protein [Streptosporangiaceae bacterium]|nr:trypsin-like peptidase domain-containing protein [Streptosporangiaceae bacterium]